MFFPSTQIPLLSALTGMGGGVATYGMLSIHDGSAVQAINTDGTTMTALNTNGVSNNVVLNASANNVMTIQTAGVYMVWLTLSGSAADAQTVVHHHIQVNGVDSEVAFDRKYAANDTGDGVAVGILSLSAGEELSIELTPTVNTNYTFQEGQFGCWLIG